MTADRRAKTVLPRLLYLRLVRTFDLERYVRQFTGPIGRRSTRWYNFTNCDLCPPEAFGPKAHYCTKGLCPHKLLCDGLLRILEDKVAWFGDSAMYLDAEREEAETRIRAARHFIEETCECIEDGDHDEEEAD